MPKKIPHPFTAIGIRQCQICGQDFFWVNKWGKAHQRYCGRDCAKVAKSGQSEKCPLMERPKTTPRTCLRCLEEFPSTGIENRICNSCQRINLDLQRNHRCDSGRFSI